MNPCFLVYKFFTNMIFKYVSNLLCEIDIKVLLLEVNAITIYVKI